VLKTKENLAKDEIEKIKEKYIGDFLPDGWYFNGTFYVNVDGEKKFEHPNLEFLFKTYLDE
jgi:hypothetical protein